MLAINMVAAKDEGSRGGLICTVRLPPWAITSKPSTPITERTRAPKLQRKSHPHVQSSKTCCVYEDVKKGEQRRSGRMTFDRLNLTIKSASSGPTDWGWPWGEEGQPTTHKRNKEESCKHTASNTFIRTGPSPSLARLETYNWLVGQGQCSRELC